MDILNTRNILKRKNHRIQGNNYNCVLCQGNTEETAFHLFFGCTFSKHCWQLLGIHCNTHLNFFDMLISAKMNFPNSFYMEMFIIGAWQICKQRNNLIFKRNQPSLQDWKQHFIDESLLQAHRLDIDECKERTACQCKECKCKNTWGSYECGCCGGLLYMEHDTCISKNGATEACWGFLWVIFFGLVAAGIAGYAVYKYRIRRYMDSEIWAIMAQSHAPGQPRRG